MIKSFGLSPISPMKHRSNHNVHTCVASPSFESTSDGVADDANVGLCPYHQRRNANVRPRRVSIKQRLNGTFRARLILDPFFFLILNSNRLFGSPFSNFDLDYFY